MIDIANIKVKAGNGGDGNVSFRREKFVPRGGPDGGDGGNGGSVYFVASTNMATLRDFRQKDVFKAFDGEKGGKKKMSGSNGVDVEIKVPVGTLVYEYKDGAEILVADMYKEGTRFMTAKGGRGGKGNFRFRSSTNQTPLQFTPGEKGQEKTLKLEIKLVADIGLIGAPNAGKSTLINTLTNANVKVANYPFTTLEPNLGTLTFSDGASVVLSDIPGLIEGASSGKGLGDEFLRHVERTRVLVHLIDPTNPLPGNLGSELVNYSPEELARNAKDNYRMIRAELESYGKGLQAKPELIVINKTDLAEVSEAFSEINKEFDGNTIGISAATGEGFDQLFSRVRKMLADNPKITVFEAVKPVKMYNIQNLPNKKMVFGDETVITDNTKKI